jgi:hypothetical protein
MGARIADDTTGRDTTGRALLQRWAIRAGASGRIAGEAPGRAPAVDQSVEGPPTTFDGRLIAGRITAMKFFPRMITLVPPRAGPPPGESELMRGAATYRSALVIGPGWPYFPAARTRCHAVPGASWRLRAARELWAYGWPFRVGRT